MTRTPKQRTEDTLRDEDISAGYLHEITYDRMVDAICTSIREAEAVAREEVLVELATWSYLQAAAGPCTEPYDYDRADGHRDILSAIASIRARLQGKCLLEKEPTP